MKLYNKNIVLCKQWENPEAREQMSEIQKNTIVQKAGFTIIEHTKILGSAS
jgi:hypothetical protein